MEEFLRHFYELDALTIYAVVSMIAFVENLFPPFPSDVFVVGAGALAAAGRVDFALVLLLSSAASTAGFMTMYKIGAWFGRTVLDAGRWSFFSKNQIDKVESWVRTYGLWVIVVNRFLAGTRAVVSFVAGFSKLSLSVTATLSFLSSLAWNFLLLSAGKAVGNNWARIVSVTGSIGRASMWTFLAIVAVTLVIWLVRRNKKRGSRSEGPNT